MAEPRTAQTLSRILCLMMALPLLGCELLESEQTASGPEPNFRIAFHVTGEDEEGVAGAEIALGKNVLGTTKGDGKVILTLEGREGDRVALKVRCPAPFDSPEKPRVIGLRHLAPGSPPATFSERCSRSYHTFVIGIRAEKGRGLPVIRLGQEVATTDAFGAAHVLVEAAPNEHIALRLDTTDQHRLRPQNPTLTFVTGDKDEFVLLEQKFNELRVKAKPRSVVSRPTPL